VIGLARMTGAGAVATALASEKVRFLFELPGSHTLHLYDVLRSRKEIQRVTVRYENNASFMADTVGRLTGEPGVCLVTAGPGATNGLTGVATAYAAASPMIQLSGTTISEERVSPFHGVDDPFFLEKVFKPVTKMSARIDDPAKAPGIISKAFAVTRKGRKGSVHLSLPPSFQKRLGQVGRYVRVKNTPRRASDSQIRQVTRLIGGSKKPIICLGEEAVHLPLNDITTLAEKLSAPVICTMEALGIFPQDHALFAGYLDGSFRRHPIAKRAMEDSDYTLIIGLRPGSPAAQFLTQHGPPDEAFIFEESPPGQSRSDHPTINGSVNLNTHLLTKSLPRSRRRDPRSFLEETRLASQRHMSTETSRPGKALHPGYAMRALLPYLRPNCILAADVGNTEVWLRDCISVWHRSRHLYAGQYGGMGSGVPAGIASQLLFPNRQVVSVVGDGGLLMSLSELATITQYGLKLKIIVLNDSRYGMIWQFQRQQFHGKYVSVDLTEVDFAEIAKGFGIKALRVENPSNLDGAYQEIIPTDEAGLLDLVVDSEVPYLF